jgi:outer membrane protein
MTHPLALVGLLVCPIAVLAQQPSPVSLSLADALAIAREHNPAYLQAQHDRAPAAWGVRNAYAAFLPAVTASGGLGYAGPGQEDFLTTSFLQPVAIYSSNYNLGLSWQLSGATLSQPGLRRAQLAAADADIAGAAASLTSQVTQEYLAVLAARDNATVAQARLDRDEQFLGLAHARYDVGRATLLDVRQAEVARGQAKVALLRAQMSVDVEKLRLYQILGTEPPPDLRSVTLTDSFPVVQPPWQLEQLLTMAEAQNPDLQALRARERAATWGVRAASASYGPSLSLSAGWSGFTQKVANLGPVLASAQAQADTNVTTCNYENMAFLNAGQMPLNCSVLKFTGADSQAVRAQNGAFPYHFTAQPFQALFTVTVPIFANFSHTLQISQARAQRDDLDESVRARGLQVRTDVSQAYLTLETAYATIAIQDTNRTAAREQLALATERYGVGSGTFFELLDAQVAALSAESDYVSAVYDYHTAWAALEAAVGRPLL